MAPEIADSDGESDIMDNHVAEEQPIELPTPAKANTVLTEQVSPPQIDFDDFVHPTQALSDQSQVQNGIPGPGTGSTEKMLRGLAKAQQNLAGSSLDQQLGNITGKRRHSASESGPSSTDEVSSKKKRVKTYGSKSRSGSTIDLHADLNSATEQHTSSLAATKPGGSEEVLPETALDEDQQSPVEEMATVRERDRPRRVLSLLGQTTTAPGLQLSTTTSSYGGYQGFEIDFRGASNGLDINANPFAGLSQPSAGGEDLAGLEGDVQKEMMTSPDQPQDTPIPDSINPAMLMQNGPPEAWTSIERPSKRRKTENLARGTTASPAPSSRRAASVCAESVSNMSDKSRPKKRGRKAQSSKLANSSQQEAMAPPELPEPPPSRISRRGTLDSSQASHDETPSNSKRKRKKSKPEPKPDENAPTKRPSSELHLDDEKIMGLPKENYKPRPSRRRSRQISEHEEQQQEGGEALPEVAEATNSKAEESSPPKQPTSELNLSDEQLIGLPKENYKPRPSRRRSRPVVEDDQTEADWTGPLPEKPDDLSAKPESASSKKPKGKTNLQDEPPADNPAEPQPTPPKPAKKPKKSKVKRAKTSAAALLKKSSQMLSDGEDDVLWLDERPAAVKLDLPRDLKALKKEEEETKPEAAIATPKRGNSKISVEIPVPMASTSKPSKELEPETAKKKRGRPKKLPQGLPPSGLPPGSPGLDKAPTPEPLTEAENDDIDDEDEEDDDIRPSRRPIRCPLASKNANALPAPPISPAKLPHDDMSVSTDKENAPPPQPQPHLTPTKTKTSITTPSPTKGPTSHSPINPASAWNSKSKYRVGLSKRQSIPSLLRKVDKTKAAPTKVGVKVKERKIKVTNEDVDGEDGEGGGGGGGNPMILRDRDGNLVEWEF